MRSRRLSCAVVALATVAASAQSTGDRATLDRIKSEGLEHSQAAAVFDYLTIDIGPRLTASPAHKRAAEWTRDRLAGYGLSNAHLEPWTFGRGWELQKLTLEMIEPRYLPLIGYADAWSAATAGEIVAAPVLVGGKPPEEVAAMAASLKGAIVLSQPMMTNFVRKDRPQPSDPGYTPMSAAYATSVGQRAATAGQETPQQRARRMTDAIKAAGAAVVLKPSVGEHGTVFVGGRDGGAGATPAITHERRAVQHDRPLPAAAASR